MVKKRKEEDNMIKKTIISIIKGMQSALINSIPDYRANRIILHIIILSVLSFGYVCSEDGGAIMAFPESNSAIRIVKDGEPYAEISLMGWGPKWKPFIGFKGKVDVKGEKAVFLNSSTIKGGSNAKVDLTSRVFKSGTKQLKIENELKTSANVALTYIVAAVNMSSPDFADGKVSVMSDDGKKLKFKCLLARMDLVKQ
jgi:hypothetical protein